MIKLHLIQDEIQGYYDPEMYIHPLPTDGVLIDITEEQMAEAGAINATHWRNGQPVREEPPPPDPIPVSQQVEDHMAALPPAMEAVIKVLADMSSIDHQTFRTRIKGELHKTLSAKSN